MKKYPSQLRQTAPLVLAIAAATPLQAGITGTQPPLALNWVKIADTTTVALDRAVSAATPGPLVPGVPYARFDPPVVTEFDETLAFKGWLALAGGVTPANNEGVWSTAPMNRLAPLLLHTPTLVLREGDPVPSSSASGATFGLATILTIQNLQSERYDWTVCATNTSLGKIAVASNNVLYDLGESGPALGLLTDLRPPVAAGFQLVGSVAMWKRNPPNTQSAVERIASANPSASIPPLNVGWDTGIPAVLSCAGFSYMANQPPRVGSPAISEAGWVAAYARDIPGAGVSPNHIQLRNATLGAAGVIVREKTPSPAIPGLAVTSPQFGIIHNQLMATSDSVTAGGEAVAWQMQTMINNTLPVAKTSLWCKSAGGVYNCLAYQTQVAPFLPAAYTITGFYALHAVPDYTTPGGHLIVWGAMLPGNKVAIYLTRIDGAGFMLPPDLIATNVPGPTPVDLFVGGTSVNITSIDRFFSVNVFGTVLFKAQCAAAPAGFRNILVTADLVNSHSRKVRAQSGLTGTLGLPGGIAATNYILATPEQGSQSRGQAIGSQWIGVKALYSIGQGIYFSHL